MSLSKPFIASLKKDYAASNIDRRRIISASNELLHDSKRAIFATHRGDVKGAEASLKELDSRLSKLQKNYGFPRLMEEGAYNAAIEEYVEAKLFYLAATGKAINKITGLKIAADSYLGGLSDVTGELVRLATNSAAQGKWDKVKECHQIINQIMVELVDMDLTGYLRTKYDQAKSNLRKIEQMAYEIKLANTRNS
jgi:predicted translin family RNA/ssDNA-binding protein